MKIHELEALIELAEKERELGLWELFARQCDICAKICEYQTLWCDECIEKYTGVQI
jgi:hypothetical protein